MKGAIEMRPENTTVSRAVRFDGDDGIEEQKKALRDLLSYCEHRGLQGAVKQEMRHIDAMEQKCSAIAPDIYGIGDVGTEGRGDQFRHGSFHDRAYMDVDDFASYFAQCRRRSSTARGEKETECDMIAQASADSGACLANELKQLKRKETVIQRTERFVRSWFAPDDRMHRCRGERRCLPVSMIATFFIIAVSLMLMVSGTVMVAEAKSDVSELKSEVSVLSDEASLLQDKLEANTNYLEIYRIATEDYGMVDANFVNASYLNAGEKNRIESYNTEETPVTGLASLLAAIGIQIGD